MRHILNRRDLHDLARTNTEIREISSLGSRVINVLKTASPRVRSAAQILLGIGLMGICAYSFAGVISLRILLEYFTDPEMLGTVSFGQTAAVVAWLDPAQELFTWVWRKFVFAMIE